MKLTISYNTYRSFLKESFTPLFRQLRCILFYPISCEATKKYISLIKNVFVPAGFNFFRIKIKSSFVHILNAKPVRNNL